MIDRDSRDKLAEALRQFVSGRISNDDLEDIEIDGRDRGVLAVQQRAWHLYSDLYRHRAIGRHRIGEPFRRDVCRWIVFLHSDEEYLWPEQPFVQGFNWPLNLLTLGWWERRRQRRWSEFESSGDLRVWPFISRSHLESAVAAPRLLAGHEGAADTSP